MPEPELQGRTNLDLALYALRLRAALAEANAALEAVRLWVRALETGVTP